jgi:alpha-ketoglutarate-dependent 2,4-dichlorophenoxyacetate dioxygenase
MSLTLQPLHPLFVAEVGGIDLRQAPGPDLVAEIDAAMDRHAVLVFRDQPLSEAEQLAFASAFGTLDPGLSKVTRAPTRFMSNLLLDISNLRADGSVAPRDDNKVVSALANQLWHSDSSFQCPAGKYSMLHPVALPESGGETEYADLRAAWDALSPTQQAELEGLVGEHFALHTRIMLGHQYTEEQMNILPPVLWPLVRTLPSGRRTLYHGVHVRRIVGWPLAEARLFLSDLLEHATQRRFVYRHEWRLGDLVIWDNRCTVHRGRRFDLAVRRELRRTTTLDVDWAPELRQPAMAQAG